MRRIFFTVAAAGALLFAGNTAYAGGRGWDRGHGHHHHDCGPRGYGYYNRGFNSYWVAPPPRFSVGYQSGFYPRYGYGAGYRGFGPRNYGYGGRGLSISFGF